MPHDKLTKNKQPCYIYSLNKYSQAYLTLFKINHFRLSQVDEFLLSHTVFTDFNELTLDAMYKLNLFTADSNIVTVYQFNCDPKALEKQMLEQNDLNDTTYVSKKAILKLIDANKNDLVSVKDYSKQELISKITKSKQDDDLSTEKTITNSPK